MTELWVQEFPEEGGFHDIHEHGNNHISGFEFLHGIPGTIGGSLKMNAGAFGSEIWDLVEFVTVVNSKGKLVKLSKKDFRVSY